MVYTYKGKNLRMIITVFLLIMLVSWRNHLRRYLTENSFQGMNTEQYLSTFKTYWDNLNSSAETKGFTGLLNAKNDNVRLSGKHSVSTNLTSDEEEKLQVCIENGDRDRKRNIARFWKNDKIRHTHHTYLAKEDAVLIEVGGNTGVDAAAFVRLYNPRYTIMEPVEDFAKGLSKMFKDNPRVKVVKFGLGAKNEVIMVKLSKDATSQFSGPGGTTPLYIRNATEYLLENETGLYDIDLLTLNCEGCEFELLESILSSTLVNMIRNIQFATHSTLKHLRDSTQRYCKIQQLLLRTHRPTYQFELVWESWRRRDLN